MPVGRQPEQVCVPKDLSRVLLHYAHNLSYKTVQCLQMMLTPVTSCLRPLDTSYWFVSINDAAPTAPGPLFAK